MSDKKKDTKEDKVEEKDKKSEGLGLLEEVGLGQFRIASSRTFDFGAPAQSWFSSSLGQDDEFEEFPADEWSADEEDAEDVNVWEDNWDEDTVEDDFSKQLRAELDKASKSQDVEMKS